MAEETSSTSTQAPAQEQPQLPPMAAIRQNNQKALEERKAAADTAVKAAIQELSAPEPEAKPETKQSAAQELERKNREAKARRLANAQAEKRSKEFEAKQKDLEARQKALDEREAILKGVKDDPFNALLKLGLTPEDLARHVPDYLEGKVKPPPPADPLVEKLSPLEKELKELREWKEAQERSSQETSQQRAISSLKEQAVEAIKDQDAFELVHQEGGAERVFQEMMDGYGEAQRMLDEGEITEREFEEICETRLTAQNVAKYLEEQLTEEMKRKAQSKRFKNMFQERQEEEQAPQRQRRQVDVGELDRISEAKRKQALAKLREQQAAASRDNTNRAALQAEARGIRDSMAEPPLPLSVRIQQGHQENKRQALAGLEALLRSNRR